MNKSGLSRIAITVGMAVAALMLSASPSHAQALKWFTGGGSTTIDCVLRAGRKLPRLAPSPYTARLRQDEEVLELLELTVTSNGALTGTARYSSEDICNVPVTGQLVLDSKTGAGSAEFDLAPGSVLGERTKLPCKLILGNRSTVPEILHADVTRRSPISELEVGLIGQVDFANPKALGGVVVAEPVAGTCTRAGRM